MIHKISRFALVLALCSSLLNPALVLAIDPPATETEGVVEANDRERNECKAEADAAKEKGETPKPCTKESSSFDVFDILRVDPGSTIGEENINENFRAQEKKYGSVAAALIIRVINILSLLIGFFAFIMIVLGGFMLVTAGGEEGQLDRAKSVISQAIIGMLIGFGSYFIVNFTLSFFF